MVLRILTARVYQCPCRPGWYPDGQLLLGAVLSGARDTAGRRPAREEGEESSGERLHGGGVIRYILRYNDVRKVRPTSRVRRSGANCCR